MASFDRSSKWLIQHHGDSLLRLAGVQDLVEWRALQAELVQPGQLPDGLIEARRADSPEPELFVVEIATYPERRLQEQLLRDTLLTYLDRRVVPEVLALILRPKGRLQVADTVSLESPRGWAAIDVRWRIVELWKVAAQELLQSGDPGLVPWVPLSRFAGRPEPVIRRCRELIESEASQDERADLLAVTQVLTRLRYNDSHLLAILGGQAVMIESPLLDELRAEWTASAMMDVKTDDILSVLQARFGPVPQDLGDAIRRIKDLSLLDALLEAAAKCQDMATFQALLHS